MEPLQQDSPAAGVAGSEDANARQLAFRRKRPDHTRTRGAVPAEIACGVLLVDDDLVSLDGDGDRLLDFPYEGMACLDSAVEHAYARARAGCTTPRPLAVDLAGPFLGQDNPVDGLGRQAPGGKLFLGHVRSV